MILREIKSGGKNIVSTSVNNGDTGESIRRQRYNHIPIDYLKAQIIDFDNSLITDNELLDFRAMHNAFTGEELKFEGRQPRYTSEYKNFVFKYFPESDKMFISGSLHKRWNEGIHNYNDFTFQGFNESLNDLKNDFSLSPENIRLTQLEFGINLNPLIEIDSIVDYCLVHKRKVLEPKICNEWGNYKDATHSNYIIKAYDKGLQYGVDRTLRFEIKQTNWSEYRKMGITTLQDFINSDKSIFIDRLLSEWTSIIYSNPDIINHPKWSQYSNYIYWKELNNKSRKTYKTHLDRLRRLNKTYELDIQDYISNLILSKINDLQGVTISKTCKLTGLDISMQKEDSILISHRGLKILSNSYPEQFDRLTDLYLSYKWHSSSPQLKLKELAHNIRNHYFNRLRKSDPNQLSIF